MRVYRTKCLYYVPLINKQLFLRKFQFDPVMSINGDLNRRYYVVM